MLRGARAELALENLIEALPKFNEPHMTTMEIWHACKYPKFSYGETKRWIKWWVGDCAVEKIGRMNGPQFYRSL